MKIKDIIFCWDLWSAIIISVIICFIAPVNISLEFAKDIYSVAISVLSIIFTLYFASLAIIITADEDDFVEFLEEDNIYSGIIDTFKFTLFVCFISLIYAIILYSLSSYYMSVERLYQNKIWIISFSFFFFYSLFAVFNATLDAIKYFKKRIEYMKIKKGKH